MKPLSLPQSKREPPSGFGVFSVPGSLLTQRFFSPNQPNVTPVTREQLHARTAAIAELSGRLTDQIQQADYEQAKRELGL